MLNTGDGIPYTAVISRMRNGRGCSYARGKTVQRTVLVRSKRTPLEHGVAARSRARA